MRAYVCVCSEFDNFEARTAEINEATVFKDDPSKALKTLTGEEDSEGAGRTMRKASGSHTQTSSTLAHPAPHSQPRYAPLHTTARRLFLRRIPNAAPTLQTEQACSTRRKR